MNQDIIKGNWKKLKGKAKVQWGKLTGSHVEVMDGKRVELSGEIQEGYGNIKDTAEEQIDHLEESTKK
ncbi:MAG: CsbD family protein [Thiohalomonadaceae bacterium]